MVDPELRVFREFRRWHFPHWTIERRRHNNNNRLDTRAIQKWITDTMKAYREK
jgi:hypothetical protein